MHSKVDAAKLLIYCKALLQDGNMGLVKLVLAGRTKRAIQRLTQTFLTLSLADIAQQVGLQSAAEAEGHILRFCYSVFCDKQLRLFL